MALTGRQQREIEYHREHAQYGEALLSKPFSYAVLNGRRPWNAYWEMFRYLRSMDVFKMRVLVVGCGFGEDAVRLAELGADVDAFDLSEDSLSVARQLAQREGVSVRFGRMPAEALTYQDGIFDLVLCRDILHHVDIPAALSEMHRVSKPQAVWVVNEIYSHSWTELVRRSALVERLLYPALQRFVYGRGKPYITEDERKLDESEIAAILAHLSSVRVIRHFNFVVTRLIPDAYVFAAKADQVVLRFLKPLGRFLGGRVLLVGSR